MDQRTFARSNEKPEAEPERAEVFDTPLVDTEHTFRRPAHISKVYGISVADAEAMVSSAIAAHGAQVAAEFAQNRSNLKDTALRKMDDVPSAVDLLANGVTISCSRL